MSNQELLEFGKKYMEQVGGFIKHNQYRLVDIKENYCVMEADIREETLNYYGVVHGGFIFGLADTACGVAARATGRKAVTMNSHIEYLHALRGNKIKVVAEAIKTGKNISVYEASIFDDNEVMVAKAIMDYFYINQKQFFCVN